MRRYLLYNTFLHEVGHLQIVDRKARRIRRKFASETKAQAFANRWRQQMWSEPVDDADPVHNPPSEFELELLDYETERQAEPRQVQLAHF